MTRQARLIRKAMADPRIQALEAARFAMFCLVMKALGSRLDAMDAEIRANQKKVLKMQLDRLEAEARQLGSGNLPNPLAAETAASVIEAAEIVTKAAAEACGEA
jgi:hypothetical protein